MPITPGRREMFVGDEVLKDKDMYVHTLEKIKNKKRQELPPVFTEPPPDPDRY